MALVLGALAVPVAAVAGASAQAASAREAERQRSLVHVVPAQTLEAAIPDEALARWPVVVPVPVRVAWVDNTGTTQESVLPVNAGTPAGAEVSVWLDADGNIAARPPSTTETLLTGVWAAIAALAGAWLPLALVVLGARWALDRRRLRLWGEEWRQVGPRWTGRGTTA
jgi:hypothetical protein